jgi:hypothetical protein
MRFIAESTILTVGDFMLSWINVPGLLLAALALQQLIFPAHQEPPKAPPPPRVEAPAPVTPQRIVVGKEVQAGYDGPAPRWHFRREPLSDSEIANLEKKLSLHPDDICARGQLAAFAPSASTAEGPARIDHLIWMIQHHPEWDGFILNPNDALSEPRSQQERSGYDRLRTTWLQQVEPNQHSGAVLHNAAMFFAIREPEFAANLLQRAIYLEPDVPLHVERLGIVYACALYPTPFLKRFGVTTTPEREAFAQQAQAALLASDSWVLLAGALTPMGSMMSEIPRDLVRLISARLQLLTGEADARHRRLPSQSYRERDAPCDTAIVAH